MCCAIADRAVSSDNQWIPVAQAARLAEASQGLRNARTIVSLSPQDLAQGSELLNMFQAFLAKALDSSRAGKKSQS